MKLRVFPYFSFWAYYFLLMVIYHLEIKKYFYWTLIAGKLDDDFDFSFTRMLFTLILFAIDLKLLISKRSSGFIYAVGTVFFLILTTPSLVAYTSGAIYPTKLLLLHQLFFFTLMLIGDIKIDFDRIPTINRNQAIWLFFLTTIVCTIPYLIAYGPHINLKNILLINVYETRSKVAGITNPYFGYTYSLFTKIIIPLLLVFSLERKNRLLTIISIAFLVLFYLFGAHKSVYLGTLFILIFYRFSYDSMVRKMVLAVNVLIVLCLFLALFSSDFLWILTIRRVMFTPTLLDICYFDFFEGNPIFWSESFLGSLIDYPYDIRSTNLIGKTYFNRVEVSANNGLISDGYVNANTLGVLINILLVSGYFMVLNNVGLPSRYFGLYFRVALSFISSSLITVFVTHGAIVLLVISIFILGVRKSKTLRPNNSSP